MFTVLISRSGSTLGEVLETAPYLQKHIDKIISTKQRQELHQSLDEFEVEVIDPKQVEKHLLSINPTIIILIGYMRILSEGVCKRHQIYNLHPGDIERYPALKGKDPIERLFESVPQPEDHVSVSHELGCVIHKVIPEVDAGEIVRVQRYFAKDYKDAVIKSQEVAVDMWIDFLSSFVFSTTVLLKLFK